MLKKISKTYVIHYPYPHCGNRYWGGYHLQLTEFWQTPSGERLVRIQQSPNYREGKFQNLEPTLQFTSDDNILKTAYHYFFPDVQDLNPSMPIPAVQTDLQFAA